MSESHNSAMAAALALMGQHGEDAGFVARLQAAECAAAGDGDGLARWGEVLACLANLSDGAAPD